jgi:hypothetical protein
MDDLAARLQALFRSYAVAIDLHPVTIDRLCVRFREELGLLVAEYGHAAVDKAIDELPMAHGRQRCFIEPDAAPPPPRQRLAPVRPMAGRRLRRV